jgi:hypothetical protein
MMSIRSCDRGEEPEGGFQEMAGVGKIFSCGSKESKAEDPFTVVQRNSAAFTGVSSGQGGDGTPVGSSYNWYRDMKKSGGEQPSSGGGNAMSPKDSVSISPEAQGEE